MTRLIADPFVQTGTLAIVGAVITRVLLRRYAAWRLLVQLVFFAALTALLHHHDIVPYEVASANRPLYERAFIATAKIVWWINAAWLLTGFARVFLIFERQPREDQLVQELVVGMVYLGTALSVVAYVFDVPIGTLIATSGVFAIILGLALQNTLADLFAGIALNVSKPYEVGDWIVLKDDIEGRVVETNWRATHLLNASNDLVALPNSGLAKAQLTNLSSPNRSHGVKVRIRMMPTITPSSISEILRTVLLSTNSIMPKPTPTIEIKSLDAQAIEFELSFRVQDFSVAAAARHEVYDLVYRHAKAAGLALAQPKEAMTVSLVPAPGGGASAPRPTALRMLDAVPLFSSLTEEEKDALAPTMTRRTYLKGEVVTEQAAKLTSLFVVRTGVLVVSRHENGSEVELSRLSPGDFFGDAGLVADQGEPGTIRAFTFAVIYEVCQPALTKLVHERPSIADEISATLSSRAKQVATGTSAKTEDYSMRSMSQLANRIRTVFDLSDQVDAHTRGNV